jgi:hypothetical protein
MQYLTLVKYYATETNPVKLGRGKMMNNKKEKTLTPKEKNLTQGTITMCRKNLKIPTNLWKFPLKPLSPLPN